MSIQVLRDEQPTARKSHYCDSCNRVIDPGERYHNQTNVGDDGLYTWHCCAHCDTAYDYVWRTDPDARYGYDDGLYLPDYLAEYAQENTDLAELHRCLLLKWRVDGVLMPLPALSASPAGVDVHPELATKANS